MVSEVGGIDDKNFNQTAWAGMEQARDQLGIQVQYLQSAVQEDYARNLDSFVSQGCDIIVVGFLLVDAAYGAAEANPNIRFAIIDNAYDYAYDSVGAYELPNLELLEYATDEAAMLVGYASASWSKTKKMGTFGGFQTPPVTDFMDGFVAGANYWNQQHGDTVSVLGWDPVGGGSFPFTGNFDSVDDGKQLSLSFLQEGADVIMGVGGPIGQGAFEAIRDQSADAVGLGVDVDWADTHPEDTDLLLTSALKRIQQSVFLAVQRAFNGEAPQAVFLNNLANDGVGIAPFHDYDGQISQQTKDEIDALKAAIIGGSVKLRDWEFSAPDSLVALPEGGQLRASVARRLINMYLDYWTAFDTAVASGDSAELERLLDDQPLREALAEASRLRSAGQHREVYGMATAPASLSLLSGLPLDSPQRVMAHMPAITEILVVADADQSQVSQTFYGSITVTFEHATADTWKITQFRFDP